MTGCAQRNTILRASSLSLLIHESNDGKYNKRDTDYDKRKKSLGNRDELRGSSPKHC